MLRFAFFPFTPRQRSATPRVGGRARGHVARRLAAFVVDAGLSSLLVFLVAAAQMVVAGPALRLGPPRTDPLEAVLVDTRRAAASALVGVVTGCAYFCLSWRLAQATPGQRLLGLRVRGSGPVANVTLPHALLRWAVLGAPLWIAASSAPGWSGVLATVAAFGWSLYLLAGTAASATGEGPHDRLSGTRVERSMRVARAGRFSRAVEVADVR